ncbi:hypothetical protein AMAG_06562 [Allomyces macrogynus ATCC 38327]|uniref:Uncharacterized protein n=1 Tax=Allomyces macrogynus (strain ATCC 38327) TaxID=578462 RepID=A0A0L0SH39_ALLM3|nr:hypothetical protein AMAG_06562 [Allomyces macrogynus ATCC 38327]|eukprot:KNE61762.1 hypothetical protein AMAG_06562 [Allomyces macrogynus ATCC 38327]
MPERADRRFRRRRSASGPDTINHSDGDDDDDADFEDVDADESDVRARSKCPDGWRCPLARKRCPWTAGMSASIKLAKLAEPPETNVYYQCLPDSPYLDLARHCAKELHLQEMSWVFCRGPGGCYSIWLRIYKHLKPALARTTLAVSPAPASTPPRSSRQSAPAAVLSVPSSSKRERSASPPPPPPPPPRPRRGTRADSVIVSSTTPDRARRDRPPPPPATSVPAALVTHHLALANAQVALQTQRTFLELRTRMHALGYSREEIDREVAIARGMSVAGMMGMGSAGWRAS